MWQIRCRERAAPPLSGLGSASYSWDVRGEFFTRNSGSRAQESLAPCDGVPARPWPCSSLQGGGFRPTSAPAASPPEASIPCWHVLAPCITEVSGHASLQRGLKEPAVVALLPGGPPPPSFLCRTYEREVKVSSGFLTADGSCLPLPSCLPQCAALLGREPVSPPGMWELFRKFVVDNRVRTALPAAPQLGPGLFQLPLAWKDGADTLVQKIADSWLGVEGGEG